MAKPEAKVKAAIKSWLKANNFYFFMPIGGPYAVHGVPDIIVCAQGRFVAIECKAPGKAGNTTANQNDHIARIGAAGGIAFVAEDLSFVRQVFLKLGLWSGFTPDA